MPAKVTRRSVCHAQKLSMRAAQATEKTEDGRGVQIRTRVLDSCRCYCLRLQLPRSYSPNMEPGTICSPSLPEDVRRLFNLEVSSAHRLQCDPNRLFSQKSPRPIVYRVAEAWWRAFLSGADQDELYLATKCMPRRHMSISDFAIRLLQTADPRLHRIALRLTDSRFMKCFLFLLPLLPHLGFTVFTWGVEVQFRGLFLV